MDNAFQKMIIFSAVFCLFLGALAACIHLIVNMQQAVRSAGSQAQQQDRDVHVSYAPDEDEIYTGTQVLQTLAMIGSIGVDIQVGSITFAPDLDLYRTDFSAVQLHRSYKPELIRDGSGNLQRIQFRLV